MCSLIIWVFYLQCAFCEKRMKFLKSLYAYHISILNSQKKNTCSLIIQVFYLQCAFCDKRMEFLKSLYAYHISFVNPPNKLLMIIRVFCLKRITSLIQNWQIQTYFFSILLWVQQLLKILLNLHVLSYHPVMYFTNTRPGGT